GHLALFRSGGVLPFGEPVDLVVDEDDLQVHVAAQGVDEVVAADGKSIPVAGDDPDGQLRTHELQARGDGRCAAMDGVEAVGVHVIRKAGGTADAGDEHVVFAFRGREI